MATFPMQQPVPLVDQVGVDERAAKFTKRSIKNEAKAVGLKMAVSMMDLTTLEGADSKGKVTHLCRKALRPMADRYDCPPCAAVCVYPNLVAHAVSELKGTGIPVASVATGFPSGQYPLDLRIADVRDAVSSGAEEIDMVISRGRFLEGELNEVLDEIAATKEACGKVHLKVIFETGELQTYDNVRLISQMAIEAGADFIKTSTGKEPQNATLPVSLVMLRMIRDYHQKTGHKVGFKPAGGIRTAKQALEWQILMNEELGREWLEPELFRFGASGLLTDIERQLEHFVTGRYSAAYRQPMG